MNHKIKDTLEEIRFSKLTRNERYDFLNQLGLLTKDDVDLLINNHTMDPALSELLIENCIGAISIPLGVSVNFIIDEKEYLIPMATEETSVIASASKTAKWIASNGSITTEQIGNCVFGQIQFPVIECFNDFKEIVSRQKNYLIDLMNQNICHSMAKRGGGAKDIIVRSIDRGKNQNMAVVHVVIDTCDAMGANIITQVCEYIKPALEDLTHSKAGIAIVSNLPDTKITQARIAMRVDEELGHAITEASLFAKLDPYRAATNNKGVMNAIDSIVIATGNDWRAVNAGVHAYAARKGRYSSITKWTYHDGELHGLLKAPIQVGIVGGVTQLNPIARLSLKMMSIQSAHELARVIAAAGLVQNLGALRALVSEGLVKGHMKLHIDNICLAAGVLVHEKDRVKALLLTQLEKNHTVHLSDALTILQKMRAEKNHD